MAITVSSSFANRSYDARRIWATLLRRLEDPLASILLTVRFMK